MILQALKEYYDRKASDPESGIAPEGFEIKAMPFLIVINDDGTFRNIEDTREGDGRNKKPKSFLVPRSQPRAGSRSYETTFFLWDHIGYLFGEPVSDPKSPKQHATWLSFLKNLPDSLKINPEVSPVLKFYGNLKNLSAIKAHSLWNECIKTTSCNMSFKIAGRILPVPCSQAVVAHVSSIVSKAENNNEAPVTTGVCLVTGEVTQLVRITSDTRIGKDAKKLVGFQKNSGYDSYGKEQCLNAPIGKPGEFAFTTALNTLLKSGQRMLVGDAVTIFWSEKDSDFEKQFTSFFNEPAKDDPDRQTVAVRSLFSSVHNGSFSADESQTRFYVLGLSPNAARISIRFWIVGTIADMAQRICQHFDDLKIIHGPKESEFLSLFRLLVSTATQGKSENIPPNIAGETMRSILEGLPYPKTLLHAAIRRIRAEREISYPRASLIKACLNRNQRFYQNNQPQEKELTVSLDKENTNIGYRLGRLFATLEKIQQEANPGINATIRDRFYSSASASPVMAFGNLMRGKNHHLAKLENAGRKVNFERLLGEIMSGIPASGYPSHLNLDDQGRFAIGYYHQMQDFFQTKTKDAASEKGDQS